MYIDKGVKMAEEKDKEKPNLPKEEPIETLKILKMAFVNGGVKIHNCGGLKIHHPYI